MLGWLWRYLRGGARIEHRNDGMLGVEIAGTRIEAASEAALISKIQEQRDRLEQSLSAQRVDAGQALNDWRQPARGPMQNPAIRRERALERQIEACNRFLGDLLHEK